MFVQANPPFYFALGSHLQSKALLSYNPRTWTLNLFYIFQFSVKRQNLWYLWILHCARCTNFKHRLPTKYLTIQHETNCSNSPFNTAFRRGIIHFCQLFHWIVYFDKPQTAKLNYRYRLRPKTTHGIFLYIWGKWTNTQVITFIMNARV